MDTTRHSDPTDDRPVTGPADTATDVAGGYRSWMGSARPLPGIDGVAKRDPGGYVGARPVDHHAPRPTARGDAGAAGDGGGVGDGGGGVPFGLPVLAEVPRLAAVLAHLVDADRAVAAALAGIIGLQHDGAAEHATGVGLEHWLAVIARRTGSDVRMLKTAADACRRLPALHDAFVDGRLSWSQTRAVALMIRPLPRHLDERLDDAVAGALWAGSDDADPNALIDQVRWAIHRHHPQSQQSEQAAAEANQFVSMQPRLDGSGGKLYGELGPQAWAITDEALNHGILPDPDHPDRGDGDGGDGGGGGGVPRWYSAGRKRAARLTAILDHHLATHGHHPTNTDPDHDHDDHGDRGDADDDGADAAAAGDGDVGPVGDGTAGAGDAGRRGWCRVGAGGVAATAAGTRVVGVVAGS